MLDLVIAGPDMSGTTTQISNTIKFFENKGFRVRDIRGTEIDALFHAEEFLKYNKEFRSLQDYLKSQRTDTEKNQLLRQITQKLIGGGTNQDLQIASMVQNECSTFIDPNSADVWIMEEPTKRGAGQVNRTIEQNRSKYKNTLNATSAALAHQAYRTDEFLRFRRILRENNGIIVRSRSEESACYQIYDEESLHSGITEDEYLQLPGHKIAFGNAPTNIFIACAIQGWTKESYLKLKQERSGGRALDDHESNWSYQILVNERYRTNWLENLYTKGCELHQGETPSISRFDLYDSMKDIEEQMNGRLENLL